MPMFIMLTFDDALTTSLYNSYFQALSVSNDFKLFNPSGCRIKWVQHYCCNVPSVNCSAAVLCPQKKNQVSKLFHAAILCSPAYILSAPKNFLAQLLLIPSAAFFFPFTIPLPPLPSLPMPPKGWCQRTTVLDSSVYFVHVVLYHVSKSITVESRIVVMWQLSTTMVILY